MKTFIKELDNLLEEKNSKIAILEWENQQLKKENEELKKENAELRNDIEKYKENEVKMYE